MNEAFVELLEDELAARDWYVPDLRSRCPSLTPEMCEALFFGPGAHLPDEVFVEMGEAFGVSPNMLANLYYDRGRNVASPYCWTITRDHMAEQFGGRSAVGLLGPRNAGLSHQEMVSHPSAQTFRLKDGDDEVYCEGVLVDLTGDASGFEPLDDYGTGALGATSIEFLEGGRWSPL